MFIVIFGFNILHAYTQQIDEISNFETKAQQAGINLNSIKSQTTISRYTVTKLLNAVECNDCIIPSQSIISYYTEPFWGNFTVQP